MARLVIENEDEGVKIPYLCLIDSGADETVSFASIGLDLRLDFKNCPKGKIGGLAGDLIVYRKKINVIINGYEEKIPLEVLWIANKQFDPNTDFTFMIGRKVFFEKFDVTFQESKKKFYLKPV